MGNGGNRASPEPARLSDQSLTPPNFSNEAVTSDPRYAPRWDCGSEYHICVELLDQRKKPIRTFQPERVFFQQGNDESWCQMTHVFKDYGPGVRFIRFTHGGKDTQFWKGWYGVRVTNSSVEICQPPERKQ